MKECYRINDNFGQIIVSEHGDVRILSFDSSLQQTCINIEKPHVLMHEYTRIMLLGNLFVDAKNMTLLGLGGGAFANCLSYCYPEIKVIVIELRQCVIGVAYDWFCLSKSENLKVVCSDANDYIKMENVCDIDLLFSDLYDEQGMSERQLQTVFIEHCFKALSEDGCLVVNFHEIPSPDSLLMQKIKALFVSVFVCDVFKGNRVVFCCKSVKDINGYAMKKRLKTLEKETGTPLLYYFNQLEKI